MMTSDEPLTPEQLIRAANFLFGAVTQAEKYGQVVIVLPLRTAHALGRAVLEAVNSPQKTPVYGK